MRSSPYYKCFNPNPLGKETGDCVIRSICAVTDKSWYEVYDLASAYAREHAFILNSGNMEDDIAMMENVFGLKSCSLPKRERGKKAMTVGKFCKDHPTGRYILRLAHHLMGIRDGHYFELYAGWDDCTVYRYYEL